MRLRDLIQRWTLSLDEDGKRYSRRRHALYCVIHLMYWGGWAFSCYLVAVTSVLPSVVRIGLAVVLIVLAPSDFPILPYRRTREEYLAHHPQDEPTGPDHEGEQHQ